MEIEKEVLNAKFLDSYHKVSVNIIFTYNWLNNLIRLELDQYQITQQQFNILRILRGQHPNPSTINILKERMLDKMSDTSRIVDRLIQKELVTKSVNTIDRRAVDIRITEKGLVLLSEIHIENTINEQLKNNLSDEEADKLSGLLDKLRG